ncbi:unnamed protein product, partial [Didymodactylos carnosus]
KDPISLQLQSDVVYHLQCKNCSDTYIGKTIRQTIRRFKEHGAPTNITSSHLPTSPLPPFTITNNNNNIFIQNTALKNKLLDIINDPEIIHFDTHDLGIKINSISPTTKSSETNPPPPIPKLYFNQKLKTIVAKHQNENHHTIDWTKWKRLFTDSNRYRLLLKEALAIKHLNPKLNRNVRSVPLLIYPEGVPKKEGGKHKEKTKNLP